MESRVSNSSKKELLVNLLNRRDANLLLKEYNTLFNILAAPIEEIKLILKANDTKIKKLEVIFELIRRGCDEKDIIINNENSFEARIDQLAEKYKFEPREHVICLILDQKNKIIAEKVLSYGGLDGAYIDMPHMYRTAIRLNANALVLIHNHPDGSCWASDADISLTRHLNNALKVLNIEFGGSFVIADGRKCSVEF